MQLELLQLLGLIAMICLAFKYFFLGPSKKPEAQPVAEASKVEKREEREVVLSSKYMPSDGKIEQQQNESEQESLKVPEENKQAEIMIKVHFQAEEQLNQSDPCELSQKQITFMPIKSDQDNQSRVEEEKGSSVHGGDTPSQQLFLSQLKKQEKDCEIQEEQPAKQFLQVLAENGNAKFGETQSNDYQRSSSRHDVQVKDVVSQCQQLDIPQEQVHSNAYRIEVSQLQCKRRHKLKVVKQHYKSIIQNLKRKLQEVCIKHNQSIGSDVNNQTITFSEEQSSFFAEEQKAQLQVKVEEVATLRTELQLHEQILTTIIEEDGKLKDQLKTLQQQNNELKTALHASMIHSQQGGLKLSGARSDKIVQSQAKSEDGGNSISGNKILSEGIQGVQSRIIELYTSQIFGSSPLKSSLFASSQALPKTSTISMMSLIEGVFTIGLLGQCRFLNQISKKFAIGEIKKFRKQKMTNARLIYSFQQQTGDYNTSIYAGLAQVTDLLILIKMQSSSIGIFTDRIYSEQDGEYEESTENKLLLLNLSKRKSYSRQGVCFYSNNVITFGEQEEGCLSEFPPFVLKGGKWCGQLQQREKVTNVAIFQLALQSQEQ